MRLTIRACCATAAITAASPVLAHGDHGAAGEILLPRGVTLVTLTYDLVNYRPLSDEQLIAAAAQGAHAHALERIAVPSISAAYGLTKSLTLGMRAPYLANKEIREPAEHHHDDGGEEGEEHAPEIIARGGVYGFGDMSFTATYSVLRDATFDASLVAGFKAPTGRKDAVDREGELFETEHQPSSGSWDGLFGATVSKQVGNFNYSASILYALAGHGSQDTTLGDRLSYGAAVSYRLWANGWNGNGAMHLGAGNFDGMMRHGGPGHEGGGHDHAHETPQSTGVAIDVSLGIAGQWWGKQNVGGEIDNDTGGNVVFLTPGLRLTVDRWAGFVNVGIPIARDLNGIQSEPTWSLSTGVALQF